MRTSLDSAYSSIILSRLSVPSTHTFLRLATTRLHHRMDQTSVLAALTHPGLRLPVYTAAMVALDRAYCQIDSLFADAAHLCPAIVPAYVPRRPLITCDLEALNAFSMRPHPRPFPNCPDSEAAYLGMRYVVEGAQLGSRVIYGHLLEAFGSQVPHFASFWIPNPAFQSSWGAVLKALAQLESRAALAAAAFAARLAFRHMALHLATNGAL